MTKNYILFLLLLFSFQAWSGNNKAIKEIEAIALKNLATSNFNFATVDYSNKFMLSDTVYSGKFEYYIDRKNISNKDSIFAIAFSDNFKKICFYDKDTFWVFSSRDQKYRKQYCDRISNVYFPQFDLKFLYLPFNKATKENKFRFPSYMHSTIDTIEEEGKKIIRLSFDQKIQQMISTYNYYVDIKSGVFTEFKEEMRDTAREINQYFDFKYSYSNVSYYNVRDSLNSILSSKYNYTPYPEEIYSDQEMIKIKETPLNLFIFDTVMQYLSTHDRFIVFDFSYNSCRPCQLLEADLIQWHDSLKKYPAMDKLIDIVKVNTEVTDVPLKKSKPVPYPVYNDSSRFIKGEKIMLSFPTVVIWDNYFGEAIYTLNGYSKEAICDLKQVISDWMQ